MGRRKNNHRQPRNYHHRKVATRELKTKFLIVCEGEETEPNYFKSLCNDRRVQADVLVRGTGYNTVSLVDVAKRLHDEADGIYDFVWCVFDKDDFATFNAAIEKARSLKFNAAYSNESFELWLLLHFAFHTAGIGREEYIPKLENHLGKKYEKSDRDLYHVTKHKLDDAIRNAKKLYERRPYPNNHALNNPSTTVHLLVEQLLEYAEK